MTKLSPAAAPSLIQNFGSVNVNGTGSAVTLTFSLDGVSAIPTTSLAAVDFTATALTCNTNITSCSASVTFAPLSAGLKQDALILKNASGNLVASAFLYGIGSAPALRALPASISTIAGNGSWSFINGNASSASFRNPQGLAIDLHGNVYVADSLNQVVRKITSAGVVSTFAGTGSAGYSGDGGPAASATLDTPAALAVDAAGNLFIADQGNSLIRRVDAVSGIITTVAGGGTSVANGVAATTAALSGPGAVAVDTADNIYIADSFHNLIREVNASSGLITTVAGGGIASSGTDGIGDGGPATSAELDNPTGIALDAAGNIYISDTDHCMVRQVNVTTGIITALAGTGTSGYSGDGGLALDAKLGSPVGLRLDANNNLYIADTAMQVVRFVNATTGLISTLAGNGTAAYTGDGGGSTAASLNSPNDVALDAAGDVMIADYANNVIRRIAFLPPTLTFPSTSVTLTSALVPVTIGNYGNATLSFSNLAVTSGFEQHPSGGTDCSSSSSLAPGVTCAADLVFAPTTSGVITGTLTVASNNSNQSASQFVINLAGTAIAGVPAFSPSASTLTFASQTVGTTSAGQTLTVTNSGSAPLTFSTIQIAGLNAPDFILSATTCQSTLAAAASCTVTVKFSPALSGSRSATLNFTDSAANSPQVISLAGTGSGGALPTFSSTALQFGSEPVATAAASQTVTLTNAGVAMLDILSIALSGADIGDFSINSTTCGSTLAASASCNVSVGFDPTEPGTRTASLLWTLSAGNSVQTVALSGTGVGQSCVSSISTASQVYLAAGATDSVAITAPSSCAWAASSNVSWIVITGSSPGSGSATVPFTVSPNTTAQPRSGTVTVGNQSETITQTGVGLLFVPITPCRIADTRTAQGPFGAPSIAANNSREFIIPNSSCNIPASAQAYALNVTAVPQGPLFYITVWPTGQTQPLVSTLNSDDGRVKANAAIVPAGTSGGITVFATNTTDLVLDINGYFVEESDTSALAFYTLAPCRLVDTRFSNGALGEPSIAGQSTRVFPVLSSTCNVPSSAQAYSLNFTVVPKATGLGYLSTWPTGQPQPLVSTLNNPTRTVVANAAIVPAGNAGDISVYASDATDVIIDIDGYFAPAQGSSALSLYNLTPCRILDTRNNGGSPFTGTMTPPASSCPVPTEAQSFVLNATVIPEPDLNYLTLWPAGNSQPVVSTLNASDGAVTSNMAIVPLSNGQLSAYAAGTTHLVLDLFGFFGP